MKGWSASPASVSSTSSPSSDHYFTAVSSPQSPSLSDKEGHYATASSFFPYRSPVPSCSLRLVFVLSTVLQVAIACILVWYIGYFTQLNTVSDLSSQLRNQTMSHMIDQITNELAVPILAVNEVDLNTAQRLISTASNITLNFDWSQDDAYYTVMANILRHYPGVTASAMQTSASSFIVAAFAFNVFNEYDYPPSLAFINQDVRTNWTWDGWISIYNQTLLINELYASNEILAASANFFSFLPAGDLAQGRAHPFINFGYVNPDNNPWYAACNEAAFPVTENGGSEDTTIISWAIPKSTVNHTTTSTTETFSICKPHIDFTPNITYYSKVANQSLYVDCPRSQFLLDQVANMTARAEQGLPLLPIVDYVADVTWDPSVLVGFMLQRLNGFIVKNGAALVVTTTGWVIASTLPPPDLNVLVYLPDFFDPPNPTIKEYVDSVRAQHPDAVPFLSSAWENLRSSEWQDNFDSVGNGSSSVQISWEQTESINGYASYVHYAVLGIPANAFSFILVVYSRQSDYQGNLQQNSTLSGVLSAIVIIVSIVITLILTQCVHQPILTLIEAMKSVVDPPMINRERMEEKKEREKRRKLQLRSALGLGLRNHSLSSSKKQAQGDEQKSGWKKKLTWNASVLSNPSTRPVSTASVGNLSSPPTHAEPLVQQAAASPSDQPPLINPAEIMRTSSASVFIAGLPAGNAATATIASVDSTPSTTTETLTPLSPLEAAATPLTTYRDIRMRTERTGQHGQLQYQDEVYSSYLPAQRRLSPPQSRQPAVVSVVSEAQRSQTNSQPSISTTAVLQPSPSTEHRELTEQRRQTGSRAIHEHQHEPAVGLIGHSDLSSSPAAPARPTTAAVVHHELSVNQQQHSSSHSSEHEDVSSYELDLLLQKWQRTMIAQGVLSKEQWETDDPVIAEGLAAAKKKYQRKRVQKRRQQDMASPRNPLSPSANEQGGIETEDRSVFTPGNAWFSLTRIINLFSRGSSDSSPHSHSYDSNEDSQSHGSRTSDGSNASDHSVTCTCNKCARHRLAIRVLSCGGQFSEVVRLQLTFGSMLLSLRNSAVKVEQANHSKRQFLRFIFHEVRVPLNALGLGVEQLHDEIRQQQSMHEQHNQHLLQQKQVYQRIQQAVDTSQLSMIVSALQHLSHLQSACPLCNQSSSTRDTLSPNELVSIIQDQVLTVTRILNDVLSFQRIEDGELNLEAQPFIVQAMVTHTLHSFQAEFKHKQLTVSAEYRETIVDDATVLTPKQLPQQQESALIDAKPIQSTDVRLDIVPAKELEEQKFNTDVEMQPMHAAPGTTTSINSSSSVSSTTTAVNDRWRVVGDQYRLRQVLSNFVSNAVKFNPVQGMIQVVAELIRRKSLMQHPRLQQSQYQQQQQQQQSQPEVAWLQISVIDTGIGINPTGLRSLFQPYHQIRPGAQQQGRGSGLGLSICKKLMELHGGQVLVQSTVGKGSNFAFRVPVAMVPPDYEMIDEAQEEEDQFLYKGHGQLQTVEQDDREAVTSASHSKDGTPLQDHRSIRHDSLNAVLLPSALPEMTALAINGSTTPLITLSPTESLSPPSATVSDSNMSPSASPPVTLGHSLVSAPLRALVVEDSQVNRKLLCMMLKNMGLEVDQAEDGQIAYHKIESYITQEQQEANKNPSPLSLASQTSTPTSLSSSTPSIASIPCQYDVIFMDDHMPNWTGVQCVTAIRLLGVNTVIFGVTGNAIAEDLQRFRRAGVTDVVTKPVSKKQILQLVQLAQQHRDQQVNAPPEPGRHPPSLSPEGISSPVPPSSSLSVVIPSPL